MIAADGLYRPCVGIALFNRQGLVFVGRRRFGAEAGELAHAWQMPQGGIDKGETPRDAALRELREETGVSRAEIIAESRDWLTYDLPRDLVPKVWKGRFRGQKQKWFALRFQGPDSEIDIETEHPEFCAWRWAAPRDLPQLIVPFKRQLYLEVLEEFAGLLG